MAPLYLFWHVWRDHNDDVHNELSYEGLKGFFVITLMECSRVLLGVVIH